jgi:hypothetical protein
MGMELFRVVLGCSLILAVAASDVRALDRVTLKDGKTIEGRVVFEGPDRIVVRVGTKDREIPTADVAEVRSRARDAREVVLSWEKLSPEDAQGRLDLAQFAREHDLEGEARLLALSVLSKDPASEAAHVFLGNEKKLGAWRIKVGSHSIPFDRWVESRHDFGETEPMPSSHFLLRTNVPLDAACNFALEMELFYVAFMEWFRPELDLYEVVEPIAVHVHADNKSYPGGSGRKGFFDPQANTVFADVSEGYALDILIHESTHALLNATAARTKEARGSIPSWIDEGLADYMSFSREGAFAHPRYARAGGNRQYFAMHAGARKPLDLSRVLALSTPDYTLSPIMGLAYAQSYTLVHFCLHGGGGAYRAKFFEFLRSCYRGKSSSTDFKAAMKIDVKPFEAEWLEWSRTHK